MIASPLSIDGLRAIGRKLVFEVASGNATCANVKPEFPFRWGTCWRQCTEYRVGDFTAEVGFLAGVVGLELHVLTESYAMFTGPHQEFFLSITPATEDQATQPGCLRLEFMIDDIRETIRGLQERGIFFLHLARPHEENEKLLHASFETPNGVEVRLWGLVP